MTGSYRLPLRFAGLAFCSSLLLPASTTAAAWKSQTGYRFLEVTPAGSSKVEGFSLQSGSVTGILFTNRISPDRTTFNRNLLNGAGVAAGDVDGDGLCDLYFCGTDADNVLFRNLGNWKFENMTASAGVACPNQYSTGAVLADVDGDGDLDLLVAGLGAGVRLFVNDGKGRFREATPEAGLASKASSTSLALADVDGDGDLDLYVANYRFTTIQDQPRTRFQMTYVNGAAVVAAVDGRPATLPEYTNRFIVSPSGTVFEFGEPDVLYLNDGKGKFSPLSFTGGAFLDERGRPLPEPPRDWGLAVQMYDFTGDGAPDIYVCNDLFTPDRIWVNDGKGRFRALDTFALRSTSTFSMGVDFADFDRDGHADFFVVDMLSRDHRNRHVQISESPPVRFPPGVFDERMQLWQNTLQRNRGDNTFEEMAFYSGVEASEWSWSPIFLDVDLDGFEDILVANGQKLDFQNVDMRIEIETARANQNLTPAELMKQVQKYPAYPSKNVAFRNRGNLTFEDAGEKWGFDFFGYSSGMALADLDNDGDLDVIINNFDAEAVVLRNESAAPRLAVRLKGLAPNVQGIGAKVKVFDGAIPLQTQEIISGGRYVSGDWPMRTFAAGSATNRMKVEVTWRNGKTSVFDSLAANAIYEFDESSAAEAKLAAASPSSSSKSNIAPYFQDVSGLIRHRHKEVAFADFERQPLLFRQLSQLGPGVSWYDVDKDGWDDLLIGSGRSGRLAYYRNNAQGGFLPITNAVLNRPAGRDLTTVLGMDVALISGASNYEDGLTNGGCIRIYDTQRNAGGDSILGQHSSTGPLSLADIDNDGDLDLFVGGRSVPGRYPEAATSLIARNESGRLTPAHRLENFGLTSGSVFSDLDGDGTPELILACEWGPVRVIKFENGGVREITAETGLAEYKGWWNGVATGDFNGDGLPDIIASNWGLNHPYRASRRHPLRLYYGDFDRNEVPDMLEAYYNEALGKYVPYRTLRTVGMTLPFVQERTPTFRSYGSAGVEEILAGKIGESSVLEANTLATMLFLNRGGKFEAVPLPPEAQLAPAFGICVGDMNGDGHEDVFLSQNFFGMHYESPRLDAGRGLWLLGDGRGGLKAVPGQESGIQVYGEQRGCALADFNRDGRIDLAVTQNGAETKLYQNRRAEPGLIIRLRGTPDNSTAVGAGLRIKRGEVFGPLREVQAGSGYWSQNSPVQVMAVGHGPAEIWVRWPGGKTTTSPTPDGAREIVVEMSGKVEKLR